jgi:hypothetical protein
MKSKKIKAEMRKVKKILKKHPEWNIPNVDHESMLSGGYIEFFRIKRDGFQKDEIWYKKR